MMKYLKKSRTLFIFLLACLLLTGCTAKQSEAATSQSTTESSTIQDRVTGVGYYFDTVVTLTLIDGSQDMLDELWQECAAYEALLSKTVTASDVAKINQANGETVTVNPETWNILKTAKEVSDRTNHAFSITVAPLVAMWDFVNGTEKMPTDEERVAALSLVNDDALVLGENYTVTLPSGMSIDLGGIAKGYIADKVSESLREKVTGATLNFGGNVYVIGIKKDSSLFRVGIQDPQSETGNAIAVVTLTDASVVTSGIYQRYFIKDGVQYHHILDPETGLPSASDLASATIIGESSMLSDAMATACIVLGSEQALQLLKEEHLDGLLITRDGTILYTENFAEKYQLQLQ